MYTEERIFGPLTFKQFLCGAVGFGLFYYLESYVPEQYQMVAIGAIVVVTIMAIFRFKPEKIGNVDEYFKVKKAELDPKAYQRMLQMKHAEVLSQIHMRKAKGFADDPELLKGAELFEKLINESENK
jgi:hypothetical protein